MGGGAALDWLGSFGWIIFIAAAAVSFGMLLLVRERATANNQQVSLSGCKGTVKQILDIANFGRLFKMT